MHRCLNILEIIELICSHFDPASPLHGRVLAALARTCSMLSGPALDRLWNTQYGLEPILRCMPPDLFDVQDDVLFGVTWRLNRPILWTDWERTLLYRSRVKSLHLEPPSGGAGLAEILPTLGGCISGGCWFPNLRSLTWTMWTHDFLSIRTFLTLNLTRLAFLCDPTSLNLSLLSSLADACPGLKKVSITFMRSSGLAQHSASMFICSSRCLTSVRMGTPTVRAITHLGELATLSSWKLVSVPETLVTMMPTPSAMFPALRLLHIARAVLRRPLASLSVAVSIPSPVTTTEDFYNTLAVSSFHSSLTSLVLVHLEDHGAPTEFGVITSRSLRSLFCFANISSIDISSPLGFDLDDSLVEELAGAWPCIESLRLHAVRKDIQPRATLKSLQYLAQSCPRLRLLDMSIDATFVPAPHSHGSRVIHENLLFLKAEHSPISSSLPVARFLSGIFPNLQSIETDRDYEDNEDAEEVAENGEAIAFHQLWAEVVQQIPEFLWARQEERDSIPS
ncbi:hypothetical protein FB451DRAFT_1280753 [Mycena latifolia]|nr:hypothetical protein FB451DRAFT_1280753 [Mycena latifolia]